MSHLVDRSLLQRRLALTSLQENAVQYRPIYFTLGLLIALAPIAHAQSTPSTAGTVITLTASGEVKRKNDVAHLTFRLEEQDKDRSAAVSRLNAKMKRGLALVKRDDATATLTTRGYTTTPVYSEPPQKSSMTLPQPIGWRASEFLDIVTINLAALPTLVADAQSLYLLQGLTFSLSEPAARMLDEERIQVSYRNLVERIASVVKAMGRSSTDAVIESIDVDAAASGAMQSRGMMTMARSSTDSVAIETPDFEPGETRLSLQMNAKVRLK